jgi:hypothetical protein
VSEPFDLRVVPLDRIVPHEEADARRVDRLVGRLKADEMLVNPPVVAAAGDDDDFVLLDGATRVAAFGALGLRHGIFQVADRARLRLETWCHVLLDIAPDRLLHVLDRVREARLELDSDDDAGGDVDPTMCTLRLVDRRSYVVHPEGGRHPFTALNPFVSAYLSAAVIARTTESSIDTVASDHPDAAGVVTFPHLTIDAVFAAARDGHRLPAGITRFLVPGRVLALNAPLDPLLSDRPLAEHNAWLRDLIAARRARGHIRHYPEAVFVLDD